MLSPRSRKSSGSLNSRRSDSRRAARLPPSKSRRLSSGSGSRSRSRSGSRSKSESRSGSSSGLQRNGGPAHRTRSKHSLPTGSGSRTRHAANSSAARLAPRPRRLQAGKSDRLVLPTSATIQVALSTSDLSCGITRYQLRSASNKSEENSTADSDALASPSIAETVEELTSEATAPKKKRSRRRKTFSPRKKSKTSRSITSTSSSVSTLFKNFKKPGIIFDAADLRDSLAQFSSADRRTVVHVEVRARPDCTARSATVKEHVKKLLEERRIISVGTDTSITEFSDPFLASNVISVSIGDSDIDGISNRTKCVEVKNVDLQLHVYQLHNDGPAAEEMEEEELSAATHWLLPSVEYDGLWESLVFDSDVKKQLLHYASTTLLFSMKEVNSSIITWNRVVLLHGPPGTGKTSLCKALAQKLCIRLSGKFRYGLLVEINSHGLFSKWYSESGKLVLKMFQKIKELINDPEALVCILIDEVESLALARETQVSANEPSDSVRVVNALLTQIDQIKRNSNVIILTTSNITGAIDLAFVDRADIKQYIGPPSPAAIYKIYSSCITELMRAGIIVPQHQILELRTLEMMKFSPNAASKPSLRLWDISQSSYSLSGRTLRKIPFLAHALFLQTPVVGVDAFLKAMEQTVAKQFKERDELAKDA